MSSPTRVTFIPYYSKEAEELFVKQKAAHSSTLTLSANRKNVFRQYQVTRVDLTKKGQSTLIDPFTLEIQKTFETCELVFLSTCPPITDVLRESYTITHEPGTSMQTYLIRIDLDGQLKVTAKVERVENTAAR